MSGESMWLHCKACDKRLSKHEILIDEELCSVCLGVSNETLESLGLNKDEENPNLHSSIEKQKRTVSIRRR